MINGDRITNDTYDMTTKYMTVQLDNTITTTEQLSDCCRSSIG